MGTLVTPKYGPRVRIAKVFTDLPLVTDKEITFGVTEFCEVCKKCAKSCPSGSITHEERAWTNDKENISSNDGVFKWHNNMEQCLVYWQQNGFDCTICMSVSPFNKPEGWLHEATRIMIGAGSGSLDKLLENLDEASGFGQTSTDEEALEFWEKEDYIHIKS